MALRTLRWIVVAGAIAQTLSADGTQSPPRQPGPQSRPVAPPASRAGPPQPGRDSGPWDHDLLLSRGIGNTFRPIGKWERGGVPAIVRDQGGRLIAAYQWFPEDNAQTFDRVALRYSTDDGQSWSDPRTLVIAGFPEDLMRPFDPTLALAPDGRVRIYFSSRSLKDHRSKVATYSAIADDGEHFTFEPGVRFGIDGRNVVDCAVTCVNGVWHYFAPEDGPARGFGYHATSADGLTFERKEDVRVEGAKRWLGCVVPEGEPPDGLRFYGTDDGSRPGERSPGKVWTATSIDGTSWLLEDNLQVDGVDPGVAATKDGDRIVIATGKPRAGTPSARRNRPPQPPQPAPPAAPLPASSKPQSQP